jgi:beta-glucanase (GH16 family)
MTEIMGGQLTNVNQQIHSAGNNPGCQVGTSDVSQNWHTYGLEWTASSLVWKIDGVTTCSLTNSIPSTPMFLIINTAMGGIGGGPVTNSTLPQTMLVDYVKVTQK